MLYPLNDDRLGILRHVQQSLHAQDAITPRDQQSLKPCLEVFPINGLLPAEAESSVTVPVNRGGAPLERSARRRRNGAESDPAVGARFAEQLVGLDTAAPRRENHR